MFNKQVTTMQEMRDNMIAELHLRACQERIASRIGRQSKIRSEKAEHAAIALENLAHDLAGLLIFGTPVQKIDTEKII